MANPILPRNKKNPSNTGRILRRTDKIIKQRLLQAQRLVLARFNSIPFRIVDAETGAVVNREIRYIYELDANLIAQTSEFIESIIEQFILENRSPDYFLNQAIEDAYQLGTGEAVINLGGISDDYNRSIAQVLSSPAYRSRLQFIQARSFETMVGFAGDTRADLARVLGEGMASGQSPRVIAKSVRQRFGVAKSRAERIARTEVNMAHRRAKWEESDSARDDLGVFTRELHLSALLPDTRQTHADRHGTLHTTTDQEEWYQNPRNAINCYLPDTKVRGSFTAGSKAHYSGDVINIVTAGGRNLTVTPNHPILTGRGLLPAAQIMKGDDLIAYGAKVENLAGVSDLNDDHADTTIEHVFGSLVEIGHSGLARVVGIDFHGDAAGMDEYVNIVDVERPLDIAVDSSVSKALHDLSFVKSNSVLHPDGGSFPLNVVGINLPSSGLLSFAGKGFSFLRRHLVSPLVTRCAAPPVTQSCSIKPSIERYSGYSGFFADLKNRFPGYVLSMKAWQIKPVFHGEFSAPESAVMKPVADGSAADPKALGDAVDGLAGLVSFDKVVDIRSVFYAGHVYDLQEISGLMVANGIIASNCRCSTVEVLTDRSGNPENPAFVAKVKKEGKSFFPSR
jgi:SPP1 gp7 family putative phage head morphogenesis protein